MAVASNNAGTHEGNREQELTSGEMKKVRITVDLVGNAVDQFEEILNKKGLSKSQAIRQALTILHLAIDPRYELILRDKEDKEPDRRIVLV